MVPCSSPFEHDGIQLRRTATLFSRRHSKREVPPRPLSHANRPQDFTLRNTGASMSEGGGSGPLELLLQAHEATRSDDDVVEQFDLQEAARLNQLLCDLDVGLRGIWVP